MEILNLILVLLFQVLSLYLFARGFSSLPLPQVIRPLLICGPLGLLVLIHIASVMTEAGWRGIYIAEGLFALFVSIAILAGVKDGAIGFAKISSPLALLERLRHIPGVYVFALLYGSSFWFFQLRDHVALPSYHDGIAHLYWFIDVHLTGFSHLAQVPMDFGEYFGESLRPFYPMGSQALMAIVTGHLVRLDFPPTTIIKSWNILVNVYLLLCLIWSIRQYWQQVPAYVLYFIALVGPSAFRFPIDATIEGGISRMIAYATVLTLIVRLTSKSLHLSQVTFIAIVGLYPAFVLHPIAFWGLALACGFAAIPDSWKDRSSVGQYVLFGVAFCFAALEIYLTLVLNHSFSSGQSLDLPAKENLSLFSNFGRFFALVLARQYGPFAIVRPQFYIGLMGIYFLWHQRWITTRTVLFHSLLILFALMVVALEVYPLPGLSLVGASFYYYPQRLAVLLYPTIWLLVGSALVLVARTTDLFLLSKLKRQLSSLSKFSFPEAWHLVIAVGLVFSFLTWSKTHSVMRYWDGVFRSALWSDVGELLQLIDAKTSADAILVSEPQSYGPIAAASLRQGFFKYDAYPVDRDEYGKQKLLWFEKRLKLIEELFEVLKNESTADRNQRCSEIRQEMLHPFSRPLIFMFSREGFLQRFPSDSLTSLHSNNSGCDSIEVFSTFKDVVVYVDILRKDP